MCGAVQPGHSARAYVTGLQVHVGNSTGAGQYRPVLAAAPCKSQGAARRRSVQCEKKS